MKSERKNYGKLLRLFGEIDQCIMVLDGEKVGSINLSPSMGEFLVNRAPEVSQKVDEVLLPMWLRQRGIDPEDQILSMLETS